MTRALIADPDLPRKARAGDADVIECIGCNQACIGHYHAGEPIGCVVNPRTGRERRLAPAPGRPPRVLVVGAGPAGVAAAVEAARCGDEVTLVEREPDIGGQLRLAGTRRPIARCGSAGGVRAARARARGRRAAPGGRGRRDASTATSTSSSPRARDPSSRRPPAPRRSGDAWDAIAQADRVYGPVLVADWGGDWAGLDAAELLAAAGVEVTLACAATVPGEGLQQYHRNLYLARLDEAGVRIRHHLALTGDARSAAPRLLRARARSSGRSGRSSWHSGAARGRPLGALEGRPGATRAGDVLGPRTLEEAILEGFMAGRLRLTSAHLTVTSSTSGSCRRT